MIKRRVLSGMARRSTQILSIALFLFLISRTMYPLPERYPVNLFFRMDAFLAVTAGLATGRIARSFLPAAFIAFGVVLLGNFFCHRVCPLGGAIDVCNGLFFRNRWRYRPRAVPVWVRKGRWFLLVFLLATAFLSRLPGFPSLAWVADPFVILTRAFVLRGWWTVLLGFLVALSIISPRLWCNCVCPLGRVHVLLGVYLRNFLRSLLRRSERSAPVRSCRASGEQESFQ